MGLQLRADELMKTMPIRDTVAGEALSMLCTSNTSLQAGDMVMRSPLARVRVLLSSNTEFRFSIQMASTGPSSTIHMNSPERIYSCQLHSMIQVIKLFLRLPLLLWVASAIHKTVVPLTQLLVTIMRNNNFTLLGFESLPPQCGKDAISPVIGGCI